MANEGNSTTTQPAPSADDIDDLFDYDVGLDGILQEIQTNSSNINAPNPNPPAAQDNSGVVLGLDEEVKVAKKRQPVAKLDESRLLSQAGIPKLRRSAKQKLKFKGKGHEFSDLARLLNFYQLWLDDLFPRAKFADGLTILERLGHSKRIQIMRREWIDEEKPKMGDGEIPDRSRFGQQSNNNNNNNNNDNDNDLTTHDVTMTENNHESGPSSESVKVEYSRETDGIDNDDDDDDLFISDRNAQSRLTANQSAPPQDDEFDELDALLREQEDQITGGENPSAAIEHDPFETASHADELEAMEGMGLFGDTPS
ncbi:hypothetical protein P175DRAFT_0502339 [Aspergillus ochraceoroseus IBT 24754]|uniref:Chromosome segregation in meiosis protein n=2 Tax=Aspergillus ochraceoroseus TaxID=138278 RepID=A0A2T5LV81_9EURO|nr:uncharacterized protein P175DRAFT_0502339 [Aspergillus ochraceoroseus IBT 24754]KKK22960.1 hypothetical protein AOCH_001478 [Aspergillus ochraceoroseus]PTU20191.1 hypothetical protein P175DRAFT_0502339 [Aspergillus ochraceoroseus IBT 24754]